MATAIAMLTATQRYGSLPMASGLFALPEREENNMALSMQILVAALISEWANKKLAPVREKGFVGLTVLPHGKVSRPVQN
jgi:hypothetical protein